MNQWLLAWILIVLVILVITGKIAYKLAFFAYQKNHRYEQSKELRFLEVKISKNQAAKGSDISATDHIQTMKQNVELMNQFYKNLYALYEDTFYNKLFWNKYVSMEVLVEDQIVKFIVAAPEDHIETFEKTISSFYPGAVVNKTEQPSFLEEWKYLAAGELVLKKENGYPIKLYESFEADPMDSLFAAYSRVRSDEKLAFQVLMSPLHEKWQKKLRKSIDEIKEGKETWLRQNIKYFFNKMSGKEEKKDDNATKHNFSSQQLADLDKKVEDELFEVKIRLLATSPDKGRVDVLLQDLSRSFQQYNYVGLNGFNFKKSDDPISVAKSFVLRSMQDNLTKKEQVMYADDKLVLNIKETSTILHFPHSRFNRGSNIQWQKYKIVAAPDNIPQEGIFLGENYHGGQKKKIYVKPDDRYRHFYIIGQTGTGKSTMMENMAVQDMRSWNGFCLIDPHGQLCEQILPYLPKERIEDLIYFDLSNVDYPIAFNPFEAESDEERDVVANDMIEMFVWMYGQEVFGPRIQDYFLNAALTLMEQPDGGTLPEVMRLFVDEAYLESKLKHVENPVVQSWWRKTYKSMGQREKKEIIPFLQSKFTPFTNGVYIRNVIGQPKSAFNFGDAMQSGKIILCNLSKGLTGEINSQLIGRTFAMQIKIHALRRAKIESKDRMPFFLYVDEFQNYVSKSFESIMSEARKYKLGLCMANQYIEQLKAAGLGWSIDLSKPIFGNVGNQLYLNVSPEDAEFLVKNVEPEFSAQDLVNMDRFRGVMKLSVDTQPSRPFSMAPYYIHSEEVIHSPDKAEIIRQISALKWGTKRELAEKEIFYRIGI